MATYKGIQGRTVQNLSSDPGTLSEVLGQLWYNSGSGKFKVAVQAAGAWSSGGELNTARMSAAQGGIQTAAVCFGGRIPADTALTEEYNGTAWTEVGDLTTGRALAGSCGTITAALVAGGGAFSAP